MPLAFIAVIGFIISGLVWRVLASIGFGLATASFINHVIDAYLVRSITQMNTALHPDVSAYGLCKVNVRYGVRFTLHSPLAVVRRIVYNFLL